MISKFSFLFLCAVIVLVNGNVLRSKLTSKVIGGDITSILQYPHQVRVDIKFTDGAVFYCGGSIIGDRVILTAAHCFNDPDRTVELVVVNLGVDTKSELSTITTVIEDIVPHPRYYVHKNDVQDHDLALIFLKDDINYNKRVGKIELAGDNEKFPQIGTIVGWGCTYLQNATAHLYSGELTFDKFQEHKLLSTSDVRICQGDSGGPLIANGKLIGVSSYIFRGDSCFMSVPDHTEWIKEEMEYHYAL